MMKTDSSIGTVVNFNGNESSSYKTDSLAILASEANEDGYTPERFKLYQNFPNPFNPSTTIRYEIPKLSKIVIKIFDIKGQLIDEILNKYKSQGTYEYRYFPKNLSSGYIFMKLTQVFLLIKKR